MSRRDDSFSFHATPQSGETDTAPRAVVHINHEPSLCAVEGGGGALMWDGTPPPPTPLIISIKSLQHIAAHCTQIPILIMGFIHQQSANMNK